MGPLGKLSISRVEKPRLGCGIYISPYVAHSWVQTGTGANMQRRQYLHSSELCLGFQEDVGTGTLRDQFVSLTLLEDNRALVEP